MAMTRMHKGPHPAHFDVARAWGISPDERQRIIAENAYYRAERRGFEPGHEKEDWLAAEEEFERMGRRQAQRGPDNVEEYGVQHAGPLGPAEDQALKRMLKSHPLRDIPKLESVQPDEAPPKE